MRKSNISSESYYRMLAALASGLSGLTVSIQSDAQTASIDLVTKSIVVPVSWTAFGGNAFIGMILHEANGHGKRSGMLSDMRIKKSPVLRSVWNVLEDVRIELGAATDWPAAKSLLNDCATAVLKNFMPSPAAVVKGSVQNESLLINTLLCVGRSSYLGQDAWTGHAKALRKRFDKVFGQKGFEALEKALRETVHAPMDKTGTAVIERITLELFDALLARTPVKTDDVNSAPSEEADDAPDAAADTIAGAGTGEGDGAKVDESPAEESSGKGSSTGSPGASEESTSAGSDACPGRVLNEAAAVVETGELMDALAAAEPLPGTCNVKHSRPRKNGNYQTPTGYEWLIPMARRAMEPLRELIVAMTMTGGTTYSSRGASLDIGRAMLVKTCGTEVFTRKEFGEEISTAISVVVDTSSSMSSGYGLAVGNNKGVVESPINMAAALSAAIIEVAVETDVAINVISFSTSATETRAFDDRTGNIKNMASSTHLSNGLSIALERLVQRPETRKIVFILTDGETDDTNECAAVLNSLVIQMLGFIPIYIQIGMATQLGDLLLTHGHLVACAANFSDICSETSKTLRNALTLHPA